ncbi:MAG: AgmX/PglI C-terminal domain-containing protein [Pseudomonadota bacterium]
MEEQGAPFDLDLGAREIESGWLYKERGVVCGPVSAAVLIDKLFASALDGDTSVSPEFGEWRPLRDVPEFEGPLAKAQQAIAAEKARQEQRRLRRNIVLGRAGLVIFVAIAFSSTGFFSGRYLATARPWEDHTDWVSRAPTIVALSVKPVVKPAPGVRAEAATAAGTGDADAQREGPTVASAASASRDSRRSSSSNRRSSSSSSSSTATKDSKRADPVASAHGDAAKDELKVGAASAGAMDYNAAGLPRSLTQNQIMKVLATQKGSIVNCLSAEAKINTDMPETVTIEFVVTAEGTPAEFKVLERQVREGNLAACLRSKVMVLRWPKVYGENKTVKIPFNIKRR